VAVVASTAVPCGDVVPTDSSTAAAAPAVSVNAAAVTDKHSAIVVGADVACADKHDVEATISNKSKKKHKKHKKKDYKASKNTKNTRSKKRKRQR